MNFELCWTPEAQRTFEELQAHAQQAADTRQRTRRSKSSKQEGLFKQVTKTVGHLMNDPRHPGLHCHEYTSLEHPYEPGGKVLEAYVQNRTPGAYRVFWCYGPGQRQITIIAITPHP